MTIIQNKDQDTKRFAPGGPSLFDPAAPEAYPPGGAPYGAAVTYVSMNDKTSKEKYLNKMKIKRM